MRSSANALPALSLILAVGLLALASGRDGRAAEPRGILKVKKAKASLKRIKNARRPRQSLIIEANFSSDDLDPLAGHDLGHVRISAGDLQVFPAPEHDADGFWKNGKGSDRWIYKEKRSVDGGSRTLDLNIAAGRFTLKVKKVNLSGLSFSGPDEVSVTLTVDGQAFTGAVSFVAKGSRWSYRGDGRIPPPDGGGGGGGGSEPPLPTKIVWRTVGSGMSFSIYYPVDTYVTASDSFGWARLWSRYASGSPPAVDFSREMVVGVLRARQTLTGGGVRGRSADLSGSTLVVRYENTDPGLGCKTAQLPNTPYTFIAVTKVPGTPSLVSLGTVLVNCGR